MTFKLIHNFIEDNIDQFYKNRQEIKENVQKKGL